MNERKLRTPKAPATLGELAMSAVGDCYRWLKRDRHLLYLPLMFEWEIHRRPDGERECAACLAGAYLAMHCGVLDETMEQKLHGEAGEWVSEQLRRHTLALDILRRGMVRDALRLFYKGREQDRNRDAEDVACEEISRHFGEYSLGEVLEPYQKRIMEAKDAEPFLVALKSVAEILIKHRV